MAAGIRIENDFGTIQVDDTYKVLCLGSVVDIAPEYTSIVYGKSGAKHPQFFYSGITGNIIIRTHIYWKGYSGTGPDDRAEVRVLAGKKGDGAPTGLNAGFRSWIFDEPTDSGFTYGMKIYNSTGQLTFDALQKNCRVVGVLVGEASMAVPAGRKYAIGLLAEAYLWENDIPANTVDPAYVNGWYIHRGMRTAVYEENGVIGTRYACFEGTVSTLGSSNVVAQQFGTARAIVVDVTDY